MSPKWSLRHSATSCQSRVVQGIEQGIRRYLAMLVVAAQEGADAELVLLVRSEMHRIVAAINVGLQEHLPTDDGQCRCGRRSCDHLTRVHRALLVPREHPELR
jgi:hypothetical protein